MAVLIGHASISENGTVNGNAGDSTGKEVCTRNWYNGTWGFMAVHKDANVREKIAKIVEQACANNKVGYSQNTRNTLNTQAKAKSYDISKITTACNCDCSSLINVAVVGAGLGSYGSNGWTTSTMESQLSKLGFKIIKTNLTSEAYAVRGAIYNRAGKHVVCALSDGSKANDTLKSAGATVATTVPPTSNSAYTGHSLVDYLKSIGVDSSFTNRSKLAKEYGVSLYIGTASQNSKLLELMRQDKSTYCSHCGRS